MAELRAKIPSQILAHYDRLVARGKKGLAAVRGQVCSGCHMQVPLGVVMTLKHGDDIQLCESCGRYLFLPPALETEAAGPVASPKPERKKRKQKKQSVQAADRAVLTASAGLAFSLCFGLPPKINRHARKHDQQPGPGRLRLVKEQHHHDDTGSSFCPLRPFGLLFRLTVSHTHEDSAAS